MAKVALILLLAVVIGLLHAANETASSEDTGSDTSQSDANALATTGHSRTGLLGTDVAEVPSYISILWCQKIIHKEDGHLCGYALWLTEQHFVCPNDAAYTITQQWDTKWDGGLAGWKMAPLPVIDINNETAGDPLYEDWKFRFKWSRNVDYGLGIWRTLGHDTVQGLKNTLPHDVGFRKVLESPFDFNSHYSRGEYGQNCHVLVYGSSDGADNSVRKLTKIDVEWKGCGLERGHCKFGPRPRDDVDGAGVGGFLQGTWSDLGAPVYCNGSITHIVTDTVSGTGTTFMALAAWKYAYDLRLEMGPGSLDYLG